MKNILLALFLLAASILLAQSPAPSPNPLQTLAFLQGTWEAKTAGGAAAASGSYTFRLELGDHVLARHSFTSDCKGPRGFNCGHNDLLYVYPEGPRQRLKAIYFDNEGHVIHYDVSCPNPATAVFLSEASAPGPQFRLIYTLKGAVLTGKFQMRQPGQADWQSYLEWSGARK